MAAPVLTPRRGQRYPVLSPRAAGKGAGAVLAWGKLLSAARTQSGLEPAPRSSGAGSPCALGESLPGGVSELGAARLSALPCPAPSTLLPPRGSRCTSLSRAWGKTPKGDVFTHLSQAGTDPPVRTAALAALPSRYNPRANPAESASVRSWALGGAWLAAALPRQPLASRGGQGSRAAR